MTAPDVRALEIAENVNRIREQTDSIEDLFYDWILTIQPHVTNFLGTVRSLEAAGCGEAQAQRQLLSQLYQHIAGTKATLEQLRALQTTDSTNATRVARKVFEDQILALASRHRRSVRAIACDATCCVCCRPLRARVVLTRNALGCTCTSRGCSCSYTSVCKDCFVTHMFVQFQADPDAGFRCLMCRGTFCSAEIVVDTH